MARKLCNILVTGGAGFIGTNFIRYMLSLDSGFDGNIVNMDALTYAGNLENLSSIAQKFSTRYFFEHKDITDKNAVEYVLKHYDIDTIVHFAAESHVDRSILGPSAFMSTNVMGTFTLLDCAKKYWTKATGDIRDDVLFHHISTDEVYGSLGETGLFTEETPYAPRSPYSASKASSDHIVMAYYYTYGLPVTLTNCSNNYGPYQFPEKLLPLMISNIKNGKDLPVYGAGKNVRDWIYVEDHNRAVALVLQKGITGQKYNIGGDCQLQNIELLNKVIAIESKKLSLNEKAVLDTIKFVKDRPGHDLRYAIDCTKIKTQLGWVRLVSLESGLEKTIDWYLSNTSWVEHIISGTYKDWITRNYASR